MPKLSKNTIKKFNFNYLKSDLTSKEYQTKFKALNYTKVEKDFKEIKARSLELSK